MRKRGTRRNWAEEALRDEEEESSSSSSSNRKESPVIQDAENQEELIEQFRKFHTDRMEGDKQ
eukprot:8936937-Karenia_brevis.AAC.1